MELTGQAIKHKTFGSGIVTGMSESTITISFDENERKFIYPDAFKEFLVLKDKVFQKQIDDLLKKREQAESARRQADQEEQERLRRLRNLRISVNSQAVFDVTGQDRDSVLSTWSVSTGRYLSGYSKGEPRIPDRLKPNSACLLTERPNGMQEEERRIVGAFMVKEDFFGDECREGIVESHERYRIALQEPLPFWKYFGEEKPRWGNTVFRYFSVNIMRRILHDIKEAVGDAEDREVMEEFYRHFCKINRLRSPGTASIETAD